MAFVSTLHLFRVEFLNLPFSIWESIHFHIRLTSVDHKSSLFSLSLQWQGGNEITIIKIIVKLKICIRVIFTYLITFVWHTFLVGICMYQMILLHFLHLHTKGCNFLLCDCGCTCNVAKNYSLMEKKLYNIRKTINKNNAE